MQSTIYALIPFLTLLHGILFAILLIWRAYKEERYADFWLAFVLFLFSINGVPYMLGWLGVETLWEKFTYLPWDGFWLAIPPSIYLFLKSLTNDQWRFYLKRDFWHFLPYSIYFIEHFIVGLIGLSNKSFVNAWGGQTVLMILNPLMNWGVEIYYFILSFKLYQNYKKWIINEFSDPDKISFTWFRNFLIIKFTVTLISISNYIIVHLSPEKGNDFYALMWWGYLMDTILIYYLSISGYTQPRAKTIRYENSSENGNASILEEHTIGKTPFRHKNALSENELNAWKSKVLHCFQTQKLYLNPELTLSELAEKLETNTSILSQVINSGFEKNFNDFVNQYRVDEFKEKSKSKEFKHLTLLAIAFECGFNSKATFNRAFKKITGQNPSDF